MRAFLGLGSNLGDREAHLRFGREALAARGVRLKAPAPRKRGRPPKEGKD